MIFYLETEANEEKIQNTESKECLARNSALKSSFLPRLKLWWEIRNYFYHETEIFDNVELDSLIQGHQ